MSVSLYYTATREQPITQQEQNRCNEIADYYDKQYPYGELYEGFYIYDLGKSKSGNPDNIILDGSTKLPSNDDEELCMNVLQYWLKCLEEIVGVLTGAQWHVHLDDLEFEWSEEEQGFTPSI